MTGQCQVFRLSSRRQPINVRGRVVLAIFDHDFLEVRRKSGNRKKCREGGTQGAGHDELGWRHCWIHGAQPAAKAVPNLCGVIDGQVLQQALGDASELDVNVVGAQLSSHGLAIGV